MSNCDREDVKKDIFQVTLLLVLSVNCQQIACVERAAVSRLAQRPVTAENGSFLKKKKAESILGRRYSKRAVQNLTFVSLNADFNVLTWWICLYMCAWKAVRTNYSPACKADRTEAALTDPSKAHEFPSKADVSLFVAFFFFFLFFFF